MKRSKLALKQRIYALAAAAALGSVATAANADVIFPQVTNTSDTGTGSLRAAIDAANANGADGAIVTFQIGSTCGPQVIHLNTQLPDPQYEIHFEGYTQPGSSPNSDDLYSGNDAVICIVLAGDNAVANGLEVASTVADSMTLSVQGVAFSGFTHAALNLRGGSNHLVAGIRMGGTVGGFSTDPNGYGVILAPGVHGATIGGEDDADFNQFGDVTNNAIYVSSSTGSSGAAHGNTIEGNKIGFIYQGATTVPLPTGDAGIFVGGYNNTIFEDDIENSGASGVHLSSSDAHGNFVELGAIYNSSGNGVLIDNDAYANDTSDIFIEENTGAGVRVVNGQGNSIEYNVMENNGGLGIDLAGEGVTPNDNDSMQPAPDYANRGLNFPVITSAAGGHFSGTVSGTLTTIPGDYQIAVYESSTCDPSGYGEGQNELAYRNGITGMVTVGNLTVQGQGSVGFSLPVGFYFYNGEPLSITATTTDANGNTSEFSACMPYTDDTIFFDNFEQTPG